MKLIFTIRRGLIAVALMFTALFLLPEKMFSDHSIAREWNECQLNCIRKYQPKPTVHARNLFHASLVMYDAWAVYDDDASTFFLGQQWGDFFCPFDGIAAPEDVQAAQEKALSYAMYRLLWQRYTNFAPPANLMTIQGYINTQMSTLGYDPLITSTDYSDGDPAKLGNYIAEKIQEFAVQDGSNQQNNYANLFYTPVNGQLMPELPGNPNVVDPNQWQSLCLTLACAQGTGPGFEPIPCLQLPCNAPALTPEWGRVVPFAWTEDAHSIITRDGNDYDVYMDPGAPPYLDTTVQVGLNESFFKWGYVMNIIWHSFHNNDDGVNVDISPAHIGGLNITDDSQLPVTFEDYQAFYDLMNGGVNDPGHTLNPVTGLPYEPQIVPRKDFTRVLSQYWADGPNSETPPGHWFSIINYVMDHPDFEKRWAGEGEILSDLEWDVRAYFALGGGIHDAAIACWGAKGAYDYTRPIMAIRWMAVKGQCTDEGLPHYHPAGLPLIPGYIELVESGDPLAGESDENVNKIKVFSWRGPVASTDVDGAGWLLGENWWTYQTANFVTPPFPGYYSGHSTFSRTGAEILTRITGDEYFPGGMAEFHATANEYLAADSGPSVDITLQWATYRDASDQCSASRIYGGLHPPQDDIPGRKVGLVAGPQAYDKAFALMTAGIPRVTAITFSDAMITDADAGNMFDVTISFDEEMDVAFDPELVFYSDDASQTITVGAGNWQPGGTQFIQQFVIADANETWNHVNFQVINAQDISGNKNLPAISGIFQIDTQNPTVSASSNTNAIEVVSDETVVAGTPLELTFSFSEMMDVNTPVVIDFGAAAASFAFNAGNSIGWSVDGMSYSATFDLIDANEQPGASSIIAMSALDINGNEQVSMTMTDELFIDTKNPTVSNFASSTALINDASTGTNYEITFTFDEAMDTSSPLAVNFPEGSVSPSLLLGSTTWEDATTFVASYYTVDMNTSIPNIDISSITGKDITGNTQIAYSSSDVLTIDTENPEVTALVVSDNILADANNGTSFSIQVEYSESMSADYPIITFANGDPMLNSLMVDGLGSGWNGNTFTANYQVFDANEEIWNIDIMSVQAIDINGNIQTSDYQSNAAFSIDTKNPELLWLSANTYNVTSAFSMNDGFSLLSVYDEPMAEASAPVISFPNENPTPLTPGNSGWISSSTYSTTYNVSASLPSIPNIDVVVSNGATDLAGNPGESSTYADFFSINIIVNIDELNANSDLKAYPNPVVSGNPIYLEWASLPNGISIDVYNAMGSLVKSNAQGTASQNKILLETNNLTPGVYFIHANSDAGKTIFNVIVTQ
jgi:hypothetical protein